jgi:hypothetical protein
VITLDLTTFWGIVLLVALVVVLVVAALLIAILAAANRINRRADEIWGVGKNIAANTIQIWQLQKTNAVAGEILGTAQTIATVGTSIDNRLAALPEALPALLQRRAGGIE